MGVLQFVFQNGLAVNQRLDFIRERDEGLCQSLDEIGVVHVTWVESKSFSICQLSLGLHDVQKLGKCGSKKRRSFSTGFAQSRGNPTLRPVSVFGRFREGPPREARQDVGLASSQAPVSTLHSELTVEAQHLLSTSELLSFTARSDCN